jgi:hypothetical protein
MSRQRIFGMLVQPAYSLAIEPLFFDFEVRANEEFRRQFLDRKPDRLSGFAEASVSHGPIAFAATRREQLRRSVIVEYSAVF